MKFYKYVKQCPSCQSWRTGIIYQGNVSSKSLNIFFLKRGMYSTASVQLGDNYNCFCCDCEMKWLDVNSHWKLVNKEYIQEQKELRNTEEALDNYCDFCDSLKDQEKEIYESQKNKKKRKKKEKKKAKKVKLPFIGRKDD